MKVTMKYYEGLGKEEKVVFDISAQELEIMVEKDYQLRLAQTDNNEVILRRTPQEIFDEMNKEERNSWEGHYRHLIDLQAEDDEGSEMNAMDVIADYSQEKEHQRQEEYEDMCDRIRQVLKPDHANMMIAICLDGISMQDYALMIGVTPKKIYDRFDYAKKLLKDILIKKQ